MSSEGSHPQGAHLGDDLGGENLLVGQGTHAPVGQRGRHHRHDFACSLRLSPPVSARCNLHEVLFMCILGLKLRAILPKFVRNVLT